MIQVRDTPVIIVYHTDGFVVPIFNATSFFRGKGRPDITFSFTKVGEQCPLYNGELDTGDLVAVIHSISRTVISEEPSFQFGVYAVVLLVKNPDRA